MRVFQHDSVTQADLTVSLVYLVWAYVCQMCNVQTAVLCVFVLESFDNILSSEAPLKLNLVCFVNGIIFLRCVCCVMCE